MALDTPARFNNLVLYEIYVRNHGPNGTFHDVEADLPRIREMGVDVIWFMPIHSIGQLSKKGSLGCPYSIADYRSINPAYGTEADFKHLIAQAHALDLEVMIDVVYNHTSHDSRLVSEHPEWFHQDATGRPVTTVPEWSDVIDLAYPNADLEEYLIETLLTWVDFGVDGFRCDVASLLPLDFWLRARRAIAEAKPGVIWLAESVHAGWVAERRSAGLATASDGELYRAFDLTYDYDIWPLWQAAVTGRVPVERYLEMLRFQDCIYPANYVKMRCVENHDQPRIMALAPTPAQALAWTAFQAFNRGALLFYAGQESGATHTPSLFDVDKVKWGEYTLQPLLTRLSALKKNVALAEGAFTILAASPVVQAVWCHPLQNLCGVFNVLGTGGQVEVSLPDGDYPDVLRDAVVSVRGGKMSVPGSAAVVQFEDQFEPRPLYSTALDFHL